MPSAFLPIPRKKVKPPNWPSDNHHKCENPKCTYANTPKSVEGRYVCLGFPGGFECGSTYVVTRKKAKQNHRIERSELKRMWAEERAEIKRYNREYFEYFDRLQALNQPPKPIEPYVIPSMLDTTPDDLSEFMRSLSPSRRAPRPPVDVPEDVMSPASSYSTGPVTPAPLTRQIERRGRSTAPRQVSDSVHPSHATLRQAQPVAMVSSTPARYHTTNHPEPRGHSATHQQQTPSSIQAARDFHMQRARSPPPQPGTPIKVHNHSFMTTSRQIPTARTVYGRGHPSTDAMTASTPAQSTSTLSSRDAVPVHRGLFSRKRSSSRSTASSAQIPIQDPPLPSPASVAFARGSVQMAPTRSAHASVSTRGVVPNTLPRHATPSSSSRMPAPAPRQAAAGPSRSREAPKPLPPLPSGHKAYLSDPTPFGARTQYRAADEVSISTTTYEVENARVEPTWVKQQRAHRRAEARLGEKLPEPPGGFMSPRAKGVRPRSLERYAAKPLPEWPRRI